MDPISIATAAFTVIKQGVSVGKELHSLSGQIIKFVKQINIVEEEHKKEKSKFNYFKPENDLENNYWFTLNDEDLNKFTGKIFPNYIIYLNNRVNDKNYPLQKNITANISNNHLKYALTWFSLAISIFLIYLYFRKKNY